MPSSVAFWMAGPIAEESCTRTISALAPCEIRLSTSLNCFSAEDCASAEMYLSPSASSCFLMAASSVFQRSSWKFDHDTPTILSFACASVANESVIAAPASKAAVNFLMISSLRRQARYTWTAARMKLFFSSLEKKNDSPCHPCQYAAMRTNRPGDGSSRATQGGRREMTVGIRHDDLRRRNRAMVISAVRRARQPSRTEIAGTTGLSPSTISAIAADLIDEGILTETKGETVTSKRGRPQVAL